MSPVNEVTTLSLLRLAMDGAALRHQAIATNIANASTPGYHPVSVKFEDELARVRDALDAGQTPEMVATSVQFDIDESDSPMGSFALDEQTADLAQNVVQYQALIKGWTKRMSILSMAVNEGGRK